MLRTADGKGKRVDGIIFDLDGTLIDSRLDIVNSVNFTLQKLGLPERSPELITSYIGLGRDFLVRGALGGKNLDRFEEALSIFAGYHSGHELDNTALYSGVKEILDLYKNKKKVVISNRDTVSAVQILKRLGVLQYFEKIFGGDDLLCMKPSACPVLKIINELAIPKDSTIMVGDMAIDIESGREAGVITCGVTYGIGKSEDIIKAGPDYIIDSILELKDIFL